MNKKRRRGRPPHDDILTPSEWRVTHAVQHGMTNRQIAEGRGISDNGVKYHVAQIFGKLSVRTRKELRQWFQPPKGSALDSQETTMAASVELGAIGQIARTVGNIQQAVQWYGEVLGLPHLYTVGPLAFFDCGGTRLMLEQAAQPSAESILYFRVNDIRRAHEHLKALGVVFINAPHMIHRHGDGTEEWLALFKDPDGRPLSLISQVKA
jgi:DNA-binding CsgD family transcriptional regulator/catechol 2,3-dioxygenase-like lactoylglutathione lyase family enzyme